MAERKYAQALRWLADGEKVLAKFNGSPQGCFPEDFQNGFTVQVLLEQPGWTFLIKPRTVKIGNREVEAPVLDPEDGQRVWFTNSRDCPQPSTFDSDSPFQANRAKGGRYFASEAAAVAAHEAVSALLRGEA